jgi:hypothetical protein
VIEYGASLANGAVGWPGSPLAGAPRCGTATDASRCAGDRGAGDHVYYASPGEVQAPLVRGGLQSTADEVISAPDADWADASSLAALVVLPGVGLPRESNALRAAVVPSCNKKTRKTEFQSFF